MTCGKEVFACLNKSISILGTVQHSGWRPRNKTGGSVYVDLDLYMCWFICVINGQNRTVHWTSLFLFMHICIWMDWVGDIISKGMPLYTCCLNYPIYYTSYNKQVNKMDVHCIAWIMHKIRTLSCLLMWGIGRFYPRPSILFNLQ